MAVTVLNARLCQAISASCGPTRKNALCFAVEKIFKRYVRPENHCMNIRFPIMMTSWDYHGSGFLQGGSLCHLYLAEGHLRTGRPLAGAALAGWGRPGLARAPWAGWAWVAQPLTACRGAGV